MTPVFLSVEDALRIHDVAIERDGGLAGVRDIGLLESALATPRQQFAGEYLHEDLGAMAAAYLYHLAMNHPFHDGKKRTAVLCAMVFLDANAHELYVTDDELITTTLALAGGTMSKADLTVWTRAHLRARL